MIEDPLVAAAMGHGRSCQHHSAQVRNEFNEETFAGAPGRGGLAPETDLRSTCLLITAH